MTDVAANDVKRQMFDMAVRRALDEIDDALTPYRWTVDDESTLQRQVTDILRLCGFAATPELRLEDGRVDIMATPPWGAINVALELKVRGWSVAQVERQAQRYALDRCVHAVCVLTTSKRLWLQLVSCSELGGKPFDCLWLGTL